MSIEAMNAVWANSAAKTTMLLTLLAIADEADDQGRNAYPSIETLARKTRQSARNVIRMVTEAEAIGEVTIQRQCNRPNRYVLTPGSLPIEPRPRPPARGDNLSPQAAPRGDNLSRRGDKPGPNLSHDPLVPDGFHDDDDALSRAIEIVNRLNSNGIEGRNRQRLAALWCQFEDGLTEIDKVCAETARDAVAGDSGRGMKVRNMSGLAVQRLRERFETRIGAQDAWKIADIRLVSLGRRISDHAIGRDALTAAAREVAQ